MNEKPARRLTAKERNKLLRACDKKCASITAEYKKKKAEYQGLLNQACTEPTSPGIVPDYYKCVERFNKTSKARAFMRIQGRAMNCTEGCKYRSGAWGNSLKNQWSNTLHRLKHTPGPRAKPKPPGFSGTRAATLKNGKKVHAIFSKTTLGTNGKFTSRKNGFYAVYCNKSDAPATKPDSVIFGDLGQNLDGYWIDANKVKSVKGSRKRDGSIFLETKDALDDFCGKNMTEY